MHPRQQRRSNLLEPIAGGRYCRETKSCPRPSFDGMLPLRTPAQTTDGKGGLFENVEPQSCHAAHLKAHANAHAETFVRSIKESGLERMILFGESSLRTAVQNFVVHYHLERNHQELANRLIQSDALHLANTGTVQRRERLGGMLNYYYRTAA